MGVQSDSINKLAQVHNDQVKKGMATYGRPLTIFNGRSAYDDAMAEVVDLAAYVTQLEQERTCLRLAIEALYGACVLFLDASGGPVSRMVFAEGVRTVREHLCKIGFYMDEDSAAYTYQMSEFLKHVDGVSDDQQEDSDISAAIMSAPFVHADMADTVGPVQDESDDLSNLTQMPEWDEGWDAGVRGWAYQENPYDEAMEGRSWEAWREGWDAGRKRWFSGSSDFRRDLEAREKEQEKIDVALYDSGDVGIDNTPEPIVPCPQCGQSQVWESGDDSVGMPGYWYCERCQEEEGVVEDEP